MDKYNGMNIEEVSKIIKILEMYKKEEEIIYDDFNNIYKSQNNYYKTQNINELEKIETEIITNINNIIKNHNNNIYILDKNINSTLEISKEVSNIFFNIDN